MASYIESTKYDLLIRDQNQKSVEDEDILFNQHIHFKDTYTKWLIPESWLVVH